MERNNRRLVVTHKAEVRSKVGQHTKNKNKKENNKMTDTTIKVKMSVLQAQINKLEQVIKELKEQINEK